MKVPCGLVKRSLNITLWNFSWCNYHPKQLSIRRAWYAPHNFSQSWMTPNAGPADSAGFLEYKMFHCSFKDLSNSVSCKKSLLILAYAPWRTLLNDQRVKQFKKIKGLNFISAQKSQSSTPSAQVQKCLHKLLTLRSSHVLNYNFPSHMIALIWTVYVVWLRLGKLTCQVHVFWYLCPAIIHLIIERIRWLTNK